MIDPRTAPYAALLLRITLGGREHEELERRVRKEQSAERDAEQEGGVGGSAGIDHGASP